MGAAAMDLGVQGMIRFLKPFKLKQYSHPKVYHRPTYELANAFGSLPNLLILGS
jgi:hypothetical protein